MARMGKAAVIGAGFYGSTTALRIAEYDLFDELVLTDIRDGWAEGIALDLSQSRPLSGFETRVVGSTTEDSGAGYDAIDDADVVVVTAGVPRKPGMSRMDLLEINTKIVAGIGENIARHAPNAVVIIVSNPLDEMTTLTRSVTGFPSARVIGQAGMLDSARFTDFVAQELGVPVRDVHALTLGTHGETMVPIPSACSVRVDGQVRPLADLLDEETIARLVERTRSGGAEVVALMKTGSAFMAPSAAAARMVRAIAADTGEVMPVTTYLHGEYGIEGVYLGVEARIGSTGVQEVIERALTDDELAGLAEAAAAVREKCTALGLLTAP